MASEGEDVAPGWYADPSGDGPARWWTGTSWGDPPVGRRRQPSRWQQPAGRRFVAVAKVAGVGLLVLVAVVLVLMPPYGWFGDNTWRAQVISVDGQQVCTTPDKGERDPGWNDPFCFHDGLRTESGEVVRAEVGDCIEIKSMHPSFYVKRVVDCA